MTGEQLKVIFKRLEASCLYTDELMEFSDFYKKDVVILLTEIERLNKIIDSMKEENK